MVEVRVNTKEGRGRAPPKGTQPELGRHGSCQRLHLTLDETCRLIRRNPRIGLHGSSEASTLTTVGGLSLPSAGAVGSESSHGGLSITLNRTLIGRIARAGAKIRARLTHPGARQQGGHASNPRQNWARSRQDPGEGKRRGWGMEWGTSPDSKYASGISGGPNIHAVV